VARNLDVLAGFLARVDVLGLDLAAVEHAGQMRADLASGGRPIGPYDVLIDRQGRSRGLCRVTNNVSEFERVSGPRLVNWVN
jgi:tRNA(fMet)-specific endonuclease VapC